MPKIVLNAGKERLIKTSGLYLSIINSTANFNVESPLFGSVVGEVGRQYELTGVNEVTFINPNETAIEIEYESANIKVSTSGKGVVTVGNEIIVKRIVEAIQVNANATVDDGKMAKKVSNVFAPIDDAKITIPNNATVEVFAAKAALNRLVAIQLVTDNSSMGKIRIGTSALNTSSTKGLFVQGNLDAPGGYEIETETPVFVHNYSGHSVTLAGGETWRA